jgi:hypothetical protein
VALAVAVPLSIEATPAREATEDEPPLHVSDFGGVPKQGMHDSKSDRARRMASADRHPVRFKRIGERATAVGIFVAEDVRQVGLKLCVVREGPDPLSPLDTTGRSRTSLKEHLRRGTGRFVVTLSVLERLCAGAPRAAAATCQEEGQDRKESEGRRRSHALAIVRLHSAAFRANRCLSSKAAVAGMLRAGRAGEP